MSRPRLGLERGLPKGDSAAGFFLIKKTSYQGLEISL